MSVLLLGGCGDGNDDKAACEAFRDADNTVIYDDLREMDLSDELRATLNVLEEALVTGEAGPDVYERAVNLTELCEEVGINLSGL